MIDHQLIEQTKENIERVFPRSNEVKIESYKDKQNFFQTKIEVLSSQGTLIAHKEDESFKKSLDKSYKAIVRQIHKIKTKDDHHHHKVEK